MPEMMSKPEISGKIRELFRTVRFRYDTERELQDGIEQLFLAEKIPFKRECPLGPGDIIDFMVGGWLGIEVKTQGSPLEVARQLLRYAGHGQVESLILVTGKSRLGALPERLLGKPIAVYSLWKSFLS